MYAVVTGSKRGVSERNNRPYFVIDMIAQDENGTIGRLNHFIPEAEQNLAEWKSIRTGSVVEVEVAERSAGFNSYLNVITARPTTKTCELNIS